VNFCAPPPGPRTSLRRPHRKRHSHKTSHTKKESHVRCLVLVWVVLLCCCQHLFRWGLPSSDRSALLRTLIPTSTITLLIVYLVLAKSWKGQEFEIFSWTFKRSVNPEEEILLSCERSRLRLSASSRQLHTAC
jgi:hypothetical protein